MVVSIELVAVWRLVTCSVTPINVSLLGNTQVTAGKTRVVELFRLSESFVNDLRVVVAQAHPVDFRKCRGDKRIIYWGNCESTSRYLKSLEREKENQKIRSQVYAASERL